MFVKNEDTELFNNFTKLAKGSCYTNFHSDFLQYNYVFYKS